MNSEYLTDEEYKWYWIRLEGVRKDISESLGLAAGMKILDIGTGYGLFAIELARQIRSGQIIGIDIVGDGTRLAKKSVKKAKVPDIVSIVKMDAVKLSFLDGCFDMTTGFLAMRDIYMTRGRKGVRKAVEEMVRVVKPNGKIVLCITPPEDMETEDQKIAVELEGEIFGAKSLPKEFYVRTLMENDAVLRETKAYFTHKRMTVNQTKIELLDGIEIQKKIYHRKTSSFEQIWDKYGVTIEAFGYGMYSKIVTLVAQKLART